SDAQSFEQAGHVDTTCTSSGWIRISNRFCRQHRAFECVGRTDVRLRGALSHEGADTYLRDDDGVPSNDFALRSKLFHQGRSVYDEIGGLTLLKSLRDSAGISVGDRYLVPR